MKITKIRLIKFGIVLIVFSFIFLKKDNSFSSINIDIETNGFRQYIDSTYILQSCDILEPYINSEKRSDINIKLLEDNITQLDYVSNAEVYLQDDNLTILIEQNNPFLRLGESYYLNKDGEKILASNNNFADVLFFSGEIGADKFKEICLLANYIYQDDFMNSLVKGIHYDEDVGYVFYPRLFDIQILFGDMSSVKTKFRKINLFYNKIAKSPKIIDGAGNILIDRVNVKYSGQIICQKK